MRPSSSAHLKDGSNNNFVDRYWDPEFSSKNDGTHGWDIEMKSLTRAARIDDAVLQFCEGFDGNVDAVFPSQGKGKRGKKSAAGHAERVQLSLAEAWKDFGGAFLSNAHEAIGKIAARSSLSKRVFR